MNFSNALRAARYSPIHDLPPSLVTGAYVLGAGVRVSVAPLAIVQLLLTENVMPSVLILLIVVLAGTPVPETPCPTTSPTVLPTVTVVVLRVAAVVTIDVIEPRVPYSSIAGGLISVRLPPIGPI